MKAKVGPFYSSRRSTSKLKNQRISIDGFKFASKLEAAVYQLLRLRALKGEIEIAQHQCRVTLSDARILYVADFKCLNIRDHTPFFVEAKGFETSDWKIKKRLWEHYGPAPLEIWRGTKNSPFLEQIIHPKNLAPTLSNERLSDEAKGPSWGGRRGQLSPASFRKEGSK